MGTICVLDPSPKTLSHQQIDGLRLLSDQVVEMLEGDAGRTMVGKDEKRDEGSQKIEGQYYSAVTILFADFVGFTKMVENTEPGDLLETLNIFFSGFEKIIQKNNVLKVKEATSIGMEYSTGKVRHIQDDPVKIPFCIM